MNFELPIEVESVEFTNEGMEMAISTDGERMERIEPYPVELENVTVVDRVGDELVILSEGEEHTVDVEVLYE